MIIGNGLLATAFIEEFAENSDLIIFASGVSNSKELSEVAFARERALLKEVLQDDKKVVYFSTCSIFDPELKNAPYVKHKLEMEALIAQCPRHAIFRLPQVVGKTKNTNTLTNFIHAKIMDAQRFDVWCHARRNIVDVSDVVKIVSYLLRDDQVDKQVVNVACPSSLSILELVELFEALLSKKANYNLVDAGAGYLIDTGLAAEAAKQIGINFDQNYAEKVIKKYYG